MKLSLVGVEMLVEREGIILGAYNDSQGYCTVGIGHLLHRSRCTAEDKQRWAGMTRQQALELFEKDVAATYAPAVESAVQVPLTDHQFDALVSLCFNIGVNGFRTSTVVKRLNAKDYLGAANAFMLWNRPSEIVPRRRGEKNQFLTPYGNQQPVQAAPLFRGPSAKFAKAEWLHPVFRLRLERLYDEVPFTNKSGGRSRQRQAELYREFQAGGNPANRPGTSWHEYDEDGSTLAQAADIHPKSGKTFAQLHAAGKRHGIHFPVSSEGWHAQPVEAKSSKRTAGQGLGPVPTYWNPEKVGQEDKVQRVVRTTKGDGSEWPGRYLTDDLIVSYIGTGSRLENLEERFGPAQPMPRQDFDQLAKMPADPKAWPE